MDLQDASMSTLIALGVLYAVNFAIQISLLIYIPKNRKPTAALAWLLFIYMIPIVGVVVFLIIGSTKQSKKRRQQQDNINQLLKNYSDSLDREDLLGSYSNDYRGIGKMVESLTSFSVTSNNKVDIIYGYENITQLLISKINSAKSYIYLEFYIIVADNHTEEVFKAIENAVKRGVEVKILFDAWGSRKYPNFKYMQEKLTDIGADWRSMLPLSLNPFSKKGYNRFDLRNHRKVVVIDNTDAIIGSYNLIDKTYHRKDGLIYTELVAHLQGPSVYEATMVFASDWFLETGQSLQYSIKDPIKAVSGQANVQIVPSGPNYKYRNNLMVFNSLIYTAKDSIEINNPYLVPDESLISAIVSASKRGVKISILNSEVVDQWMVAHAQRSYYEQLLKAGVKIYLHKQPILVHDKFMTIDGNISIVGSSNLDIRSFELNQECVVLIEDAPTTKRLEERHRSLLRSSKEVTLDVWKKRGFWRSFLDSLARLTSALQ